MKLKLSKAEKEAALNLAALIIQDELGEESPTAQPVEQAEEPVEADSKPAD